MNHRTACISGILVILAATIGAADEFKPYTAPATERENVFAFTQKPALKLVGKDKYEITFAVKGSCDVTVGMVDEKGIVVRHLGSGVLGKNAPAPFQKDSLEQKIVWNGKDDLGVYVKEPEKLKAQVSLGMKLDFHRFLGGASPYNVPGMPFGLAVDEKYAYVMNAGKGFRIYLRRYDHDGNYVSTLVPPPAAMPEAKLAGKCYVEYEPGKKALQSTDLYQSVSDSGTYLAMGDGGALRDLVAVQPCIVGNKLYYTNCGGRLKGSTRLFYVYTDGATDVTGTNGIASIETGIHKFAHMAASPDGRYIYLVTDGQLDGRITHSVVFRKDLTKPAEYATPFIGKLRKPGSADDQFNAPTAIATDDQGRIYVADQLNNRVQTFSADGKLLGSIKVDRPRVVAVHRKNGAVYIVHGTRVRGKSTGCISRFDSFNAKKHSAQVMTDATFMAVDSWSAKPRVWTHGVGSADFSGGSLWNMEHTGLSTSSASVTVWEDQGSKFVKIADFAERARKESGDDWTGPLDGSSLGNKVFCDPVREQAYLCQGKSVNSNVVFDLKTGKPTHSVGFPGATDDIIFDKRGYMHLHFNPGFFMPGVGRLDPARKKKYSGRMTSLFPIYEFPEVPYDYGVLKERRGAASWSGILPVKDQRGAKYFQDGIGCNMRGDLAVESNIYYAPKLSEYGADHWNTSVNSTFGTSGSGRPTYSVFAKEVMEREKQGEKVYFFKRSAGFPVTGSSVWTYDATGEFRDECAVIMRWLINGVHLDEDGRIYLVNASPRVRGGRFFLQDKGGRYGVEKPKKRNRQPFTGTLMRTRAKDVRYKMAGAAIKMDQNPDRPAELATHGFPDTFREKTSLAWVDGAEWFYAGASPIKSTGCSCQKLSFYLDWYKRSYVPEAYRHSIGVVDTNGNLIMHHGEFGNFDDAAGMPKGGKPIITFNRFVSASDNYMVFDDFNERFPVFKINYHEESTAAFSK